MDRSEDRYTLGAAVGRLPALVSAVLVLCAVSQVWGVSPVLWRDDTQDSFAQAETEAVSVDWDGTVRLGPALEEVAETGAEYVWALAEGRKGKVYAAIGSPGKVVVLSGGEPRPLFESEEVAAFSLAVGPKGTVFAGTSPGGFIFRILPDGKADTLCQTGDDHVWALVPDSSGGLFAATGGEAGRLLKVSAKGVIHEMYRSTDPNVVSLIRGDDGSLYAGTDANGFVYRIDAEGHVRVLYDAREKEVHALALGGDGTLYAGAMSGPRQRPSGKSGTTAQAVPGGSNGSERSAVYAIRPTGSTTQLWETKNALLLHLDVDEAGDLIVATGGDGAVHRVAVNGAVSLVSHLQDLGAWSFCRGRDGALWIGSSGDGRVHRLGGERARVGTVTSRTRDFSLVSTWGTVTWKASVPSGGAVSCQTRSGNSETPDDTWSAWSEPVTEPGDSIACPPARFLQYRLGLTSRGKGAGPALREIRLSGMQENVAPMIVSLDASPMPGGRGGKGSARSGGPGESSKGTAAPGRTNDVWKVMWSAADANGDDLIYDLYYRGREERNWKLLADDLTESSYNWQADSAPEGTMEVRVVASDRRSNPHASALSGERLSAPFDVDHTAPQVQVRATAGQRGTASVECEVNDLTSPLKAASYSVDAQDWQVVFPEDGIFDSPKERLRFGLTGLTPGEHSVVVRAVDALGNLGLGKVILEVK